MLDISDETLRGLKAMGEKGEERDPWLIYILVTKLDDESRGLWAQYTATKDFPTIQDLFEFLLQRSDALESMRSTTKRNQIIKHPTIQGHAAINNQMECPICKGSDHLIYQCVTFNEMGVQTRREWTKSNKRCFNCFSDRHAVFQCLSKRRCATCRKKHHTLLHSSEMRNYTPLTNEDQTMKLRGSTGDVLVNYGEATVVQSILPTAIMKVLCTSGKILRCRALLDSGSQASFITESCIQRLGLRRKNGRVTVRGLGHVDAGITRGITTINVQPQVGPNMTVKAFILNRITSKLPDHRPNTINLDELNKVSLADPDFYKSNEIDILLGVDHFFNILIDGQIRGIDNNLILQNTIFGWVVAGSLKDNIIYDDSIATGFPSSLCELNIDQTLRRFWEIESIPTDAAFLSPEEELCEKNFNENLRRTSEGHFEVRLPFKDSPAKLGKSLNKAIQRLNGMERRFSRDTQFYELYKNFMIEYQSLGHMKEIPSSQVTDDGFFLPHHGVIKQGSTTTKLRVVFDGSAKSSTGFSLNDCLAVGPTVQSTLYSIILRFREHRFIFSADIEKMYRQIGIQEEDTNYQKIIWRENPSDPLRYFKLCTVTYGLASAPFLATRALCQIAKNIHECDPVAARNINNNIYIDDIMTGGDTMAEVSQLKSSITTILATYGFKLRKWISNSQKILEDVPLHEREHEMKLLEDNTDPTVKILGIQYDPKHDRFKFRVNLPDTAEVTKRRILSEAGKIFDPLGWIAPVNIKIKIFIQQLWILSLDWDDPLPATEANQWKQLRATLPSLEDISIPRFVHTSNSLKVELHGFCDASQAAYAAAIYYRVTNESNESYVSLMTAKTKVSPIKQQSLPRLELCGAVLLSNLMNLVKKETNTSISQIYLWTDSTIVLDWLTAHPRRWPTFVANRTSQILSSFSRAQWGHVNSPENPADVASRGIYPSDLKSNSLWWNGPDWLREPKTMWPQQQRECNSSINDITKTLAHTTTILMQENNSFDELMSKYSSFHKLQRIIAYVLRFIRHTRERGPPKGTNDFLSGKEMHEALFKICIYNQNKYFAEDVKQLYNKKPVKPSSSLKSLNPFIDNFGVLRVRGRLEKCDAPFSTKHPIILSPRSPLTAMILHEMHKEYKHAGPSLLLALSRQQYWIISAKRLIRKIIHRCVPCARQRATCQTQLMGNLPSYRLEPSLPFIKVGVDFAGPIFVHLTRGRGQKKYKMYICLFICVTTKAVHIELVTDLSSEAFLAALKRFISRRGCCQEIFSDNGSNFIGANNQLNKTFQDCLNTANNISHFLSSHSITWHFIPPHAPHFGGIWESAIKSTKFHLNRVIGDSILTMEEMSTLLTEIESILNSRPLCVLSAEDIDALTPSHFLIGRPATKLPEYDHTNLNQSHLSRWQMIQFMSQHFWKRWQMEYISSLQQRPKWIKQTPSLQLNDIVIIKEENLPVNKWLLGKIIQLHPGSDGLTRVVTLKTKTGELKRPITKIVKLPVEPDSSSAPECS